MYVISYTVPSDPVQNVMISNVTDDDDTIAVIISWDPPTDPNGVIQYYRIEYMQSSDPLSNNNGRKKRSVPLNNTVINLFTNITNGSSGAPTNITLSGLG